MDELQLTGQNLGQVFNLRNGHLHAAKFLVLSVKLPNLQLKTRLKQLPGSLPLVIELPGKRLKCSFLRLLGCMGSSKGNGREPKTGLGRVFNFKLGCFVEEYLLIYMDTRPNL